MLKIKVEKIIEVEGKDGQRLHIPAGMYEQVVRRSDKAEMDLLRTIVAEVNDLKIQ